jgi:hypothetical protein
MVRSIICTLDVGKRKGGREWYGYGAFPKCGPLAEDSAAKLESGLLNVCTVYLQCTLFHHSKNLCRIGRQFPSVAGNSDVCGK